MKFCGKIQTMILIVGRLHDDSYENIKRITDKAQFMDENKGDGRLLEYAAEELQEDPELKKIADENQNF